MSFTLNVWGLMLRSKLVLELAPDPLTHNKYTIKKCSCSTLLYTIAKIYASSTQETIHGHLTFELFLPEYVYFANKWHNETMETPMHWNAYRRKERGVSNRPGHQGKVGVGWWCNHSPGLPCQRDGDMKKEVSGTVGGVKKDSSLSNGLTNWVDCK